MKGKGNDGMYINRYPRIYAAGMRTEQPDIRVADCFSEFLVSNPRNGSINNNIHFSMIKPGRTAVCRDMRNVGLFTESAELINPPTITKFQTLVEDIKTSVYKSYWNKQVGCCKPPEIDIKNKTFGISKKTSDNLYVVIMPIKGLSSENIISSQCPGSQLQRNYCKDSFNPNVVNGVKTNSDNSGRLMKCCLTQDKILLGTSLKQPIVTVQKKFEERNRVELETCLAPNKNINCVPNGHTFGKIEPKDNNNVAGCLTYCDANPERELFYKCLAHLNTLRKCLSKRFNESFFRQFYLQLKFKDYSMCGWLPKDQVYQLCSSKYIRFTPSLIEPLLKMWEAISGTDIKYKTFINIINFREPLPVLPKVWDIPIEFTDFSTTYKEMVNTQQVSTTLRAGKPSGRYFDREYPVTPDDCCKADRFYLPEESDAKSCLCPSVFTLLGINHRDMYTERDQEKVKKVFQAVGEDLNEDTFNVIWDCASKYHPKGIVCYETFHRAFKEYKSKLNNNILL